LNVHRISDVREIEILIVEPLGPDPAPFEFESAISKLEKYNLAGADQILV
jgi:hypothetical protein